MRNANFLVGNRVAIISAILAAILFVFLFIFLGFNQRKAALHDSKEVAKQLSMRVSKEVESYLVPAFDAVVELKNKALLINELGGSREDVLNEMRQVLKSKPNFLGVWVMMEPNRFDGLDSKYANTSTYDSRGTMSMTFFRLGDSIAVETNNYADYQQPYYVLPKESGRPRVIDPFFYQYHGFSTLFYETSVVVPVFKKGEFIGVFGVDIDLARLHTLLSQRRLFEEGYLSLFTNSGVIISHKDSSLINNDFFGYVPQIKSLSARQYDEMSECKSEFTKEEVFRLYHPIVFGDGVDSWILMFEIPISAISNRMLHLIYIASAVLIIGVLLIVLLIFNVLDRKRYEKVIEDALVEVEQHNLIANQNARNYQEIYNSTTEAIFIHDALTGRILDVNNVMLKLYGYETKEEVLKLNIKDLMPEEEVVNHSHFMRRFFMAVHDASQVFEWIGIKKGGEHFYIEVSLSSTTIGGNGRVLAVIRDISDRKLAEKELSESRQQFETIAKISPIGIYRAEMDGRIVYYNPNTLIISGVPKEDALGHGWFKHIHQDDIPMINDRLIKLTTGEIESDVLEYRFIKQDKTVVHVLANVQVDILNGERVGIVGTITDITALKKAQLEVVENERRFRDLADLLPQPLWESDLSGRLTYSNKISFDLYGFTEEDLQNGVSLFDTIVSEDKDRAFKNTRNVALGMASVGNEYTGIKKDGTRFPVKVFSVPIIRDGKPAGFRGVNFDMTQIYQAQRELRESEEKLRAIIEAFPDIIMLFDVKGNILFANEALEKTVGITQSDYNNPNRKAQVHPEDMPLVQSTIRELLTTDKRQSPIIENRFIDVNGKVHWFSGTVSKLILNNEIVLQIISKDITEQKYIQRELDLYRFDLEEMVKERTTELEAANAELTVQRKRLEESYLELKFAQERLVQAEKMASLGVLAAGVAHEINNPLNYINGGTLGIQTYIEEHYPDDINNLMPLFEAINIGVDRAADIVRSLNRFSRQTDSVTEDCDLHSVINGCLVMLNNQIKNRIEIVREYDDNIIYLVGNEGRLHQAILNILTNSVHAIADKGVITINTKMVGKHVILKVVDTGSGIPEEVMAKMFDPFFTTKEPGRGTGLGLSITYQIVKEMNGTIEYQSIVGQGTTATLTFPLKK